MDGKQLANRFRLHDASPEVCGSHATGRQGKRRHIGTSFLRLITLVCATVLFVLGIVDGETIRAQSTQQVTNNAVEDQSLPTRAVRLRTIDRVWEFSTRVLPTDTTRTALDQAAVQELTAQGWQRSSMAALIGAAGPAAQRSASHVFVSNGRLVTSPGRYAHTTAARVIVYVHGNWNAGDSARARGISIYESLAARTAEPICFIIYSWPSERKDGFARDVLAKKDRLRSEAIYLGTLLRYLPSQCNVGLLGFSFGGPVICGALHLEAGGHLDGVRFAPLTYPQKVRVSLTAPALDQTALSPGGKFDLALQCTDKLVNLYNSSDPILKRFRFFDRETSPIAAGYAGILVPTVYDLAALSGLSNYVARGSAPLNLPSPVAAGDVGTSSQGTAPTARAAQVVQFDCGKMVGRTHAEDAYLEHCPQFVYSLDNLVGR